MLTGLKSRVVRALGSFFGHDGIKQEPHSVQARKTQYNPVSPWAIRLWSVDGKPRFGPWCVPTGENAWVSRQTTRHRLRAMTFDFISKQQPLWSRRDRRRWSRAAAGLEYIRMMEDTTNVVPNEKELLSA